MGMLGDLLKQRLSQPRYSAANTEQKIPVNTASGGESSGVFSNNLLSYLRKANTARKLYNYGSKAYDYLSAQPSGMGSSLGGPESSYSNLTGEMGGTPIGYGDVTTIAPESYDTLGVGLPTMEGAGEGVATGVGAGVGAYTAAEQAAIGAGESGFGGVVATGAELGAGAEFGASAALGAIAQYIPAIGIALMAWNANQAGAGDNKPVAKDISIYQGVNDLARLLKSGKQSTESAKTGLVDEQGNAQMAPGETFEEMYHRLHSTGSGSNYKGSKDQMSTLSDKMIDNLLASKYGITNRDIQDKLGYYVPDWNEATGKYNDWWKDQNTKRNEEAARRLGKPVDSVTSNEADAIMKDWDLWGNKSKTPDTKLSTDAYGVMAFSDMMEKWRLSNGI